MFIRCKKRATQNRQFGLAETPVFRKDRFQMCLTVQARRRRACETGDGSASAM